MGRTTRRADNLKTEQDRAWNKCPHFPYFDSLCDLVTVCDLDHQNCLYAIKIICVLSFVPKNRY